MTDIIAGTCWPSTLGLQTPCGCPFMQHVTYGNDKLDLPWHHGIHSIMPLILDLMKVRVTDAAMGNLHVDIILLQATTVKAERCQVTTVVTSSPCKGIALSILLASLAFQGCRQLLKTDAVCTIVTGLFVDIARAAA